jgi:S-adenosyl methyltransferase
VSSIGVRELLRLLELLPPGVVDAREWSPDREEPMRFPSREGQVIVGVARV